MTAVAEAGEMPAAAGYGATGNGEIGALQKSAVPHNLADEFEVARALYALGIERGDALTVIVAARIVATLVQPPSDRHPASAHPEGVGKVPSLAEMVATARRLAGSDPTLGKLIDQIFLTGKRSMISWPARLPPV
ncbi:hypothetical protein DKG74_20150 [Zavarzinia aquatilis]|uniref:Uncharacterized protein n=2 Tax=Zavarzinia aquatilis TaxID=2211142 RepID=A0A317DTC4_9PROT|nr:hypothetical protein DKG74_20150 [Zavarzinia aquatilis]